MANLGNTIINGALRVNGKINTSDVISAPSFTGALIGNADTATKLANARTINDISFNGSANITIPYLKAIDLRGAYKPSNVKSGYISSVFSTLGGLDGNASDNKWVDVIGLSTWGDNGGNGVNALVVTKRTTEGQAIYHYYGDFGATTWKSKKQIAYTDSSITGNAATATKLATARTINGVNFDGSANITVADSTKLPLTGGTLSGDLNFSHAGGDNPASIGWNTGTIRQRIRILDEGTTDNNVFEFQQSRDSGGTYATLMAITADNKVKAATFVGALSGNATSATNATNTGTTNTNPTSGTWYYPTWVTGTSGNLPHRVNNGYQYYTLEGTTSATGRAILQLGNSTATGTAGNKCGEIIIYNQNKGYTAISGTSSASNFTITLPAASGTVALTSHTHSAATTSANGFMSSADKTKLNALHYVRSGTAVPDSSLGENGDIYILLES